MQEAAANASFYFRIYKPRKSLFLIRNLEIQQKNIFGWLLWNNDIWWKFKLMLLLNWKDTNEQCISFFGTLYGMRSSVVWKNYPYQVVLLHYYMLALLIWINRIVVYNYIQVDYFSIINNK